MIECTICGTMLTHFGDGHECSAPPPIRIRGGKGLLEDHSGGKVDNVGTWERLHEEEGEPE